MLRTRQAGTKQLDLRVPVDELRDTAEAGFGNVIAAPHGFGKEEQCLLKRGRQVREHQDLAHARPAGVPERQMYDRPSRLRQGGTTGTICILVSRWGLSGIVI